jgi:hypothetical protein
LRTSKPKKSAFEIWGGWGQKIPTRRHRALKISHDFWSSSSRKTGVALFSDGLELEFMLMRNRSLMSRKTSKFYGSGLSSIEEGYNMKQYTCSPSDPSDIPWTLI